MLLPRTKVYAIKTQLNCAGGLVSFRSYGMIRGPCTETIYPGHNRSFCASYLHCCRPVSCQFQQHGCEQVSSLKDMFWHHKMCLHAHHPHANVLPNMPGSAKSPPKPAAPLLNGTA